MSVLHLAENIVRLRREKEVTQEELAHFIGVTKASVSKWETSQSMPDILLLPQLASYFDVTVDQLLGYEPMLSREQIRECYHRLAADFVRKPFREVMEESRQLVKKYYACYPFLNQICILWLNHFMLAGEKEEQQKVLDETAELCRHILKQCQNLTICNNVVSIKAMVDLQSGRTAEVIEALESEEKAKWASGNELLLAQAYLLEEKTQQAEEVLQISSYHALLLMLNSCELLLDGCSRRGEKERCAEILRRMDIMTETFALEKLNPNAAAGYELQAALFACRQGEEEEALERLGKYAAAVGQLFATGITLHGDTFFDRIDAWLDDQDLGGEAVRDRKLIEASALSVFDHPAIQKLADQEKAGEIRKQLEALFRSQEKTEQ